MQKKVTVLRTDEKWFALKIFIFCSLFLQEKIFNSEAKHLCHVTKEEKFRIANCSLNHYPYRQYPLCDSRSSADDLFSIPDFDSGGDINILDLSHNYFNTLQFTASSIQKYNSSFKLYMGNCLPLTDPPANSFNNVFSVFHKLEFLDISNCSYLVEPGLPSSLKILLMDGCEKKWNLSHLSSLEELHAATNTYNTLPHLDKLAPLKFLDLRDNSLKYINITIEMLAPYCHLTEFLLSPQTDEEADSKESYCHCKKIEWWLDNLNIIHFPPGCKLPAVTGPLPPCTHEVSDEAEKLRQECLSRIPLTTFETIKYNFLLIVIVLLIIFGISVPVVILARKKYGAKSRRKRKIRKRRLMKRWKKVGEEEIEEEYYEEYEEEVDWEGEEEAGE